MQVPVVTQVPPCCAQTTLFRSSPRITTAQTPVAAFHSRSGAAWQAGCVVLIRSLQTPEVVYERRLVAGQVTESKLSLRARQPGRVTWLGSAGQLPCVGRFQPPWEFCREPSPRYWTAAQAVVMPGIRGADRIRAAPRKVLKRGLFIPGIIVRTPPMKIPQDPGAAWAFLLLTRAWDRFSLREVSLRSCNRHARAPREAHQALSTRILIPLHPVPGAATGRTYRIAV